MGQLIAKLMGIFGNQEHKVIILGLDNAGKTTILYQFLTNEAVHTCPTIGSNMEEIVVQKTHFLMWDIGGQEALRSSWNVYYANTEALRDASVLIFANKQDVKDSMTTAEISQFLSLSAIKDHPWHIQGCCALTGEGSVATPSCRTWTMRGMMDHKILSSVIPPVRIWFPIGSGLSQMSTCPQPGCCCLPGSSGCSLRPLLNDGPAPGPLETMGILHSSVWMRNPSDFCAFL
ncbi:PREDICTED: putative ADP-ribosylation factor-like protein 5C isoform X2 [Dipodomys ordii]|uniref:ADP-ribosylation factor-like protein 5C isoform X2 n=1 Tax=Dipodomys ordii TaxID=10020 RepID=A0A1S3EIQ6_DIPOR|nr:PREDICTED: putative ADP-ribosylation factor-like protein 5C isoform X2 [Dipodomys ordii]